jgi:hypothetical protein
MALRPGKCRFHLEVLGLFRVCSGCAVNFPQHDSFVLTIPHFETTQSGSRTVAARSTKQVR